MLKHPTNPMEQHSRFMQAYTDDLLARDYHAPRAKAVCEISRQLNQSTRSAGSAEQAPASD